MRCLLLIVMMLLASPAPVWRFDGEDYYLVDRSNQAGTRVLAFLRDGDSPEYCERRLWLRKVHCKDLRAYELAYTRSWDQSQRDVRYRSSSRLVHSGWVQKGSLVKWRLMEWIMQKDGLLCAELEISSKNDTKLLAGLVNRQYENWWKQLSGMMKQAPALFEQS